METEIITQIKGSGYSKQCKSDEVIEVSDSPSPNNALYQHFPDRAAISDGEVLFIGSEAQEEPIDLTFVKTERVEELHIQNRPVSTNPTRIIIQPKQESDDVHLQNMTGSLFSERGCKRKFDVQNLPNEEIIISNWSSPSVANTILPEQTFIIPESCNSQKQPTYGYAIVHSPQQDLSSHLTARQQEILKMAKSIFSKRTRTLYHWMYPTASKQQIKQVVSNTWDSMAAQEKNIYIAQVMGRFGYANSNLMVNPQLGQIKELPPMPGIQEFNPKASELQNAISSIKNETENIEQPCTSNIQRKKARVTKKKIAQNLSNACQEFDDDPELSQELAQFSIMFKNQF